jgi:hypothetical protein
MNTKKALGEANGQAQSGTGMKGDPAGNQAEPNSEQTPLPATRLVIGKKTLQPSQGCKRSLSGDMRAGN